MGTTAGAQEVQFGEPKQVGQTGGTTTPAPTTTASKSQTFPGKFMVDVHLIGGRIYFPDTEFRATSAGWMLGAAFYGRVYDGKVAVWLGGGIDYIPVLQLDSRTCIDQVTLGTIACGHDIQPAFLVMLTFEKLVPLPLVPHIRASIAGDAIIKGGRTYGAFGVGFGPGVDYWPKKWFGFGLETMFMFGGAFPPGLSIFHGAFDINIPVKFAF
jgi:hypothetical protein